MNYATLFQEALVKETIEYTFCFESLVATFLANKDLKASSEQSYRSSFVQFGIFLNLYSIKTVTDSTIKDYKDYLINKKLSQFSVISHLSAIKSFFSFLARRNLYPDVAKDIKPPKKPKGFSRDSLTKEQARELLYNASLSDDIIAKRDLAILSTLLRCGLRSVEIIRADVGDLRRLNGTPVLWIHGKGREGKDEYVVLTPDALKSIKAYLSLRGNLDEENPLFVAHGARNKNGRLTTRSIRRMVKKHLRRMNLDEKELTCHSLRHTFATLALANNAPLLAVQNAMRHSNINTTTIYTHMLDRLNNGAEHYIDI